MGKLGKVRVQWEAVMNLDTNDSHTLATGRDKIDFLAALSQPLLWQKD